MLCLYMYHYAYSGGFMNREDLQKKLDINPFTPINQIVYEHLFDDIISLKINPGSRINELKIARDTGISRSPVSSAIKRLHMNGLVEKEPGKMPRVSYMSVEDCLDLCAMRKGIEGEAAFLAAKEISQKEITKLNELHARYLSTTDESCQKYAELDCEFHQVIINASRNKYLLELYRSVQSRIARYHWLAYKAIGQKTNSNPGMVNTRYHYAIIRALENGFSALARDEMVHDIDIMRDSIRLL